MIGRFGFFLGLSSILGALSACRGERRVETADAAAMATVALLDGATPKRVHWSPPPRPARLPCKTIGVEGRITLGDAGLGIARDVPGGAWIDLSEKSKVTTKDPRTGRELVFEGPGRVAPCKPGDDEAWVLTGGFGSIPGTGEGPGAEEWVVTSLAVVRYGAAVLRVVAVDPEHVEIRVATGSASLWAFEGLPEGDAGPPSEDGWRRLDAGAKVALTAQKPGKTPSRERAAQNASQRCAVAARAARDLAEQIAVPDAALEDLAPKHVAARRIARAVCSIARLRALALPPSDAGVSLLAGIDGSDETWRTVGPGMEP